MKRLFLSTAIDIASRATGACSPGWPPPASRLPFGSSLVNCPLGGTWARGPMGTRTDALQHAEAFEWWTAQRVDRHA